MLSGVATRSARPIVPDPARGPPSPSTTLITLAHAHTATPTDRSRMTNLRTARLVIAGSFSITDALGRQSRYQPSAGPLFWSWLEFSLFSPDYHRKQCYLKYTTPMYRRASEYQPRLRSQVTLFVRSRSRLASASYPRSRRISRPQFPSSHSHGRTSGFWQVDDWPQLPLAVSLYTTQLRSQNVPDPFLRALADAFSGSSSLR